MAPSTTSSIFTPLFRLLTPSLRPSASSSITMRSLNQFPSAVQTSQFSTSSALARDNSKRVKIDPRITLIRYHLQHPKTPRPLRLSRLRALRHWTIHRAWMLFRRKKKEERELEMNRMYCSMRNACEELRNLDPPGVPKAGRLYRIAMEKKGVYQHGGVPIEYARAQTETPGKEPWNHGWKR